MIKKHHSIIKNPWEYRIIDFRYVCDSFSFLEHYFDIKLTKDSDVRNLRFIAPKELKIGEGFPAFISGIQILDLSEKQLEDIGVEVCDFDDEASFCDVETHLGSITFYAKKVIDLDIV